MWSIWLSLAVAVVAAVVAAAAVLVVCLPISVVRR
jgi:hypothetical protein